MYARSAQLERMMRIIQGQMDALRTALRAVDGWSRVFLGRSLASCSAPPGSGSPPVYLTSLDCVLVFGTIGLWIVDLWIVPLGRALGMPSPPAVRPGAGSPALFRHHTKGPTHHTLFLVY